MNRFSTLAATLHLCMALTAFGSPVINEIMYRPGSSYPENTQLEFVELYNPTDAFIDLSGWGFTKGLTYTFPQGVSIPAQGYLVLAANPEALGVNGSIGPWTSGTLSNGGETLTLSRPDTDSNDGWRTIDSIDYSDEGDWATRDFDEQDGWFWQSLSDSAGHSLERRTPFLLVDNGQNWGDSLAAGGTPGAPNSRLVADIAPVITNVRHSPAVPNSANPITISARLTDESAASDLTAALHWRNASSTSPGDYAIAAMTGDGSGRFSVTLEAMENRQIVEFYVAATDGTLTRTWPAPNTQGQTANATFQIDNEVATGTSPVYRLVLTATENAAFERVDPFQNRQFNTTFIATRGGDTTIRYLTSMRIRGNGSRNYPIRPLRIHFPSDRKWNNVDTFRIGTQGAPWVYLAHTIQRAVGLAASNVSPIKLRRQGVEHTIHTGASADFGQLVRVESFDGDYLDNHFPDVPDAQIYHKAHGSDWSAASTTPPPSPDNTWSGWSKENNSQANDWNDVINFTTVWQELAANHFTGASPGNVATGTWNGTAFTDEEVATLATIVDLDYFARWLAVQTVMANWETNLSTGQDDDYAAAFISDGEHIRKYPLPHDMDKVFGRGEAFYPVDTVPLYDVTEPGSMGFTTTAVLEPFQPLLGDTTTPGNASFREKYLTSIRELLGSVFDTDPSPTGTPNFHQFVDNHLGDWVSPTALADVKIFMAQRQAYLLDQIGEAKILPAPGTSNATASAAATPTLRINEVLASNRVSHANGARFPDVIELHNAGGSTLDLSGMRLGDTNAPTAFTFPNGTTIPASGYLLVYADNEDDEPGLHTDFSLNRAGDEIFLYDAVSNDGVLIDTVKFGFQIEDFSISRTTGDAGVWALTSPTLGTTNGDALTTADVNEIVINEWAGATHQRIDQDFVELYNPSNLPVGLGGTHLTDNLFARPERYEFRPLSYLSSRGILLLDTDEIDFGLDGEFEQISFTGDNGAVIDQVNFASQPEDYSTGRPTDGAATWADFAVPTPGLANNTFLPTTFAALLADLRITEIMYDPIAESDAKDYEFLELTNIGSSTLDLSGLRFTDGIDYTFAAGTMLAPKAQIVVARDQTRFLSRYPLLSSILAAGNYDGSLDNSGETIALTLPAPWDVHILRFRYDPAWYPLSNNEGYSLVVADAVRSGARDWDESRVWTASTTLGGDPGTYSFPSTGNPDPDPPNSGARFLNLSTRGLSLTGDNALVPGFVIEGVDRKRLLIRAVGPTLASSFGLSNVHANPSITLKRFDSDSTSYIDVANNDNWGDSVHASTLRSLATTLGAFALAEDSHDAAMVVELGPGQYTVVTGSPGGDTGTAIVELYDADGAFPSTHLLNISTRGFVDAVNSPLVSGFVISEEGPRMVLIRAIGPTLADYGVSGVLLDPKLEIFSGGNVIVANNDWGDFPNANDTATVGSQVGAFALDPTSADAAILVTLAPGVYTAQVTSNDTSSGISVVEIYLVP